ncbi:MAG: hypothetical protein ACE5Q3_01610 [Alphaproteobacteria bacterium]
MKTLMVEHVVRRRRFPIRGTYTGAAEDLMDMSVDVVVRRI